MLAGDLKEIRKKKKKNRMTLSANNMELEELEKYVGEQLSDVVTVSERKKTFLVLELAEGRCNADLLRRLGETAIDVERYGIYEPSLNDIFVEKVGEEV